VTQQTKKARGTHKPGGGTPPPIDTGSFVQWGNTRGRVDLTVTNGKVPGVEEDVEGSKDSPAVRVVIWEPDGDGYKPSRKKVGKMAHTLKRIQPLTRKGKAAPGADLVTLLADHEDRGLGEPARVTGGAVKAVYDRGSASWPGPTRTSLTRQQWATDRVKAFLAVAAGDTEPGAYSRDTALLSKQHPAHPEHKDATGEDGEDKVEVDVSEVQRHLEMFTDAD
jgi:hypothetical protein